MSNELLQAGTGIPGNNILFSNGLLDDRLNWEVRLASSLYFIIPLLNIACSKPFISIIQSTVI